MTNTKRGMRTTYEYNSDGLLEREKAHGLEYVGNLIQSIDSLGNVTENKYDELGRMIQTTDPLGNRTTYTYDDNGNVTTMEGTETTETEEGISRLSDAEMTYDEENRLLTYNGEQPHRHGDGRVPGRVRNGYGIFFSQSCACQHSQSEGSCRGGGVHSVCLWQWSGLRIHGGYLPVSSLQQLRQYHEAER